MFELKKVNSNLPELTKRTRLSRTDGLMTGRTDGRTHPNCRKTSFLKILHKTHNKILRFELPMDAVKLHKKCMNKNELTYLILHTMQQL